MSKPDDRPSAVVESAAARSKANAFVWHRRRCIDGLIAATETPSNRLHELQARIEERRAISGSPSAALQAILVLTIDKIDELASVLEAQYAELAGYPQCAQHLVRVSELLAEAEQLRRSARAVGGAHREDAAGEA